MLIRFSQRKASWEVEPEEFAKAEFKSDDDQWDFALSAFEIPAPSFVPLCAEHGASLCLDVKRREGFEFPTDGIALRESPPLGLRIFSMRLAAHREVVVPNETAIIDLAKQLISGHEAGRGGVHEASRTTIRSYSIGRYKDNDKEWLEFADTCLGEGDRGHSLRKDWCDIPKPASSSVHLRG